ncbi:MAG: hypothetical protein SFV19_12105 [Rhodospirillaceae bacterium]|nr:hypothetical protein [Rhodospirillaceae bacterium]
MTRDLSEQWPVVPERPTDNAVNLVAFGDPAFLHRVFARQIQDFGDTGGRSTRMADYDMKAVVRWLDVLDQLDSLSQYQIAMAMSYFSFTPQTDDLRRLIDYTSRAVLAAPKNRIQWLREAIVIADRRIRDPKLAMALADQLAASDEPGLNILAYQLSPLLRARNGDLTGALAAMQHALSKVRSDTPQNEIDFMMQFIADTEKKLAEEAAAAQSGVAP